VEADGILLCEHYLDVLFSKVVCTFRKN